LEILGAQKLFNESGYSFPSAHATFFFALSIIVYKENKTSGIVFLILSSIMGMARVAAGVHYPFDILGGAIMGIIIGLASIETIKNLLRKKEQTFKN
jgi:undecaprenyl-diphosphatase